MTIPRILVVRTAVLAFCLFGLAAAPATAQSQAELRRENERLRTQAADLQQELDAALQRIAELEARLAAGPGGPAQGRAPMPPTPKENVTIDESTPDSSPRGLFRAIQSSHDDAIGDLEIGDSETDSARIAYMRTLDRWAARVNREFRMHIDWHVRLIGDAVAVRRGYVVRIQAVDPITDVALGDPFDALLSRPIVSRLQQPEQRHALDGVMRFRGTLIPRMHINPDRWDEGPFNNPLLIGPFAEFGFAVEAESLTEPREEKAAE